MQSRSLRDPAGCVGADTTREMLRGKEPVDTVRDVAPREGGAGAAHSLAFQQPAAPKRRRGRIGTDSDPATLRSAKKLAREASQRRRDRVTAHHRGREHSEKAPDHGLATAPKTVDKAGRGAIFKQKQHSCEPDHTSVGCGVTGAQGVHRARADHIQTERSERKEERHSVAPSER